MLQGVQEAGAGQSVLDALLELAERRSEGDIGEVGGPTAAGQHGDDAAIAVSNDGT